MKKNVISLAIASCFVFGASLAQAQAISAPKPAFTADKATPFTGKGLNTPWNCCKQYVGFDGPRDQPGEVNAAGAKINLSQAQDFKTDPGYKNSDGNRMPMFRRANAVLANNEHTDSKAYGAGKDAATTGNAQGTGDTLGHSHFTPNSGHNQWVNK
ncbi:MAG: hypothetical protein Q8K74_06520 [Candidatus Nitrotoga sp.]|nr:hypothetical protein [Candidatus Nitrotoga sp.]MDO9446569.1 hypothetical protein [Candidatus Nitrotoga sp.]MDP1638580.1 hypothetical protein [Candidatus Nitrotoga sp.]MDP1855690.1 hypothetical protein [Candidatus Nitrotoga sp.]MDP3498254.1 hypothetical protein [Candidatus Nitrotoga sp.]